MTESIQNTKFDRPAYLIEHKSAHDLTSDLRTGELWLKIAALAAFLASAFFVVKYFVGGDMQPALWSGEQWANAFLGLGITAVITAAQAFLYSSGYKGHAATLATVVVVFFGLFADIAQSMEREDATVRHRSENSAVFQAALGSINTISQTANTLSTEQKSLTNTQAQLAYWTQLKTDKTANPAKVTHSFKTIERNIARYQQQLTALQHQTALQTDNRSTLLTGAIAQAKALEFDEDKHYAMIRLLKDIFGVSGIWASFLFSLVIIGTFEYAFNFVGGYVADHRLALRRLGLDTQGQPIHAINTALLQNQGHIPKDYGNTLREDYLKWVTPERPEHTATVPTTTTETDTTTIPTPPERPEPSKAPVSDITRERFFKLILADIRQQITQHHLKPTVRPVTDAVTDVIRKHTQTLGLQPAIIGKPERQKIAEKILEKLAQEGILLLNDPAAGKAKYTLANTSVRPILRVNEVGIIS